MKVTKLSNDKTSITLTVSGTPKFTSENVSINNAGTMTFDGSFFDSEAPVVANLPVFERTVTEPDKAAFYPFLDAVVDNNDSLKLTISLIAIGGKFKDGFCEADITLGDGFEGAKIESFKAADNGDYELVVNAKLPKTEGEEKTSSAIYGTISISAGSVMTSAGVKNEEALSYTREYSKETEGRAAAGGGILTKEDLKKIKDIVHPPKTGIWAEIETSPVYKTFSFVKAGVGYYNDVMGAYNTVKGIFQALGIIETPPTTEEKILEAIQELQGQISELNENVTVVREIADKNT